MFRFDLFNIRDITLMDFDYLLYDFSNNISTNSFFDIDFSKIRDQLYSILFDMYKNDDYRFFYSLKNNFPRNVRWSLSSGCFFIKAYMILKCYESNKDNYENYNTLLYDVCKVEEKDYCYDYSFIGNNFKEIKDSLDFILVNKNYKDMPNLRSLLKEIYINCVSSLIPNGYFDWFDEYREIYEDASVYGIDYSRASEIFDKSIGNRFALFNHDDGYFYSKILLFGKRFEYINEKLIEVESNNCLRKDIFSNIKDLSIELFEELNDEKSGDSFIKYFDMIFDSDSYYELMSKLKSLRDASVLYEAGDKKKAFELVSNLNSVEHKKKFGDKIVCYPSDCINVVVKPKMIFRREKELYSKIDDSISYDFMNDLHDNALDVNSMIDDIDLVTNRRFLKILKKKFEVSFGKFKKD